MAQIEHEESKWTRSTKQHFQTWFKRRFTERPWKTPYLVLKTCSNHDFLWTFLHTTLRTGLISKDSKDPGPLEANDLLRGTSRRGRLSWALGHRGSTDPVTLGAVGRGVDLIRPGVLPGAPNCPNMPNYMFDPNTQMPGNSIGCNHQELLMRLKLCSRPCEWDQLPATLKQSPDARVTVTPRSSSRNSEWNPFRNHIKKTLAATSIRTCPKISKMEYTPKSPK